LDAGLRLVHRWVMASSVRGAVARAEGPALARPLCDVDPAEALRVWLGELARAGGLRSAHPSTCSLVEAAGRVSAEAVLALHADPVARCAAMDGIAVRAADLAHASPERPVRLRAGDFAIVDTGQAVAPCWDSIVPSELLEHDAEGVVVTASVEPGRHIRRAGENVEQGSEVIAAGRRLTAYDVALAAACGHVALPVHPRPRVVVIPTGDEIRPPGSELAAGEAIDSSSSMLSILLRDAGAEVEVTPIVADGAGLLEARLLEASRVADLVLVIAGSARGTRDRTATAIAGVGALVVRGVALRPAHPVILARVGPVGVVGMPGYPVSTAFAFERFVRPLVELMGGLSRVSEPVRIRARLAAAIAGRADAEVQVPVSLDWSEGDLPDAHPGSRRGSALASLAAAHAVVCVPAGVAQVAAGELVDVELLPGSARIAPLQ
jgi:putative molybdopterin biosynthesis protein